MIKKAEDIQSGLIVDFIAAQPKVTFVGLNSVIRGIFYAIANVLSDIWNDITQEKRKNQLQTAKGADLYTIAAWSNISPRGAAKASVVLVFNGTSGTVVPLGTRVKSAVNNAVYETANAITIGRNSIGTPILSNTLGDTVLGTSLLTGAQAKVQAGDINALVTPITGITSVVNLVPSTGGDDAETDEQVRSRVIAKNEIYSQGVQGYYVAMAQQANEDVLTAYTRFNYAADRVDLFLLRRGSGSFSSDELLALSTYLEKFNKGGQVIKCYNCESREIAVNIEITSLIGITADQLYKDIAVSLSDYIDRQCLAFGADVLASKIIDTVLNNTNVLELDLATFTVNGGLTDVQCDTTKIPRFSQLTGKINGVSMSTLTFLQSYYA